MENIEEEERRLVKLIISGKLNMDNFRKETIAAKLLSLIEESVEAASLYLTIIDSYMMKEESYMRINIPMEILLHGVINKSKVFSLPRYTTAALMYSPYAIVHKLPKIEDLNRISLDINKSVISIFEKAKTKTIPHIFPWLGNMITSLGNGVTDISGAIQFITNKPEIVKEDVSEFDRICKDRQIRIAIIKLSYNLVNKSSLIKHNYDIINASTSERNNVVSKIPLSPFEYPTEEETSKVPYIIYGKEGPLYMFLDYEYGLKRYLPLKIDKAVNFAPAGSTPESLWKSRSITVDSLNIIEAFQINRLVAHYIAPNLYEDLEPIPPRNLQYDMPSYEGVSIEEKREVAKKAIKDYIEKLFKTALSKHNHLTKAYIRMYTERSEETIIDDLSNNLMPGYALSRTSSLLTQSELTCQQLSKNEDFLGKI